MTYTQYQGRGLLQVSSRTGGYSMSSLDDIFKEIETNPDKMITVPHDSLENSCLQYVCNVYGESGQLATSQISQYEIDMAKDIRDYYSKKLIFLALKGKKLTKFRKDLQTYIEKGYTNVYPEKFTGLIYRLPEFYAYDKQIDELRQESNNTPQQSFLGVKSLRLAKKIPKNTMSGKYFDYWFYDDDKRVYKMTVRKENELLNFFNSYLKKGSVRLSCHFVNAELDGLHYCKMRKIQLLD